MLKKYLNNTLAILSALYFLFAGTGYNIVNYCCSSCEELGIQFVASHSCEEAHLSQHNHLCDVQHETQTCCSAVTETDESCKIERVHVDTPVTNSGPVISQLSVFPLQLFYQSENFLFENVRFHSSVSDSPPLFTYILQTGRSILTQKSVLII